MLDIVLTY